MARWGGYGYGGWAPYVSVAERRRKAEKKLAALQKKGKQVNPVRIEGRTIVRTFWGKSWCDNLENYSDYANRLPRGRTYVRNGSVIDLQIAKGKIEALVSGSAIYKIAIGISALERERWKSVVERCSGQIDSLVELLQGKFSRGVMEVITSREHGLFPSPRQISLDCSCPDSATLCKHIAAVLYGVGARLDERPELFFELRSVDHLELISAAGTTVPAAGKSKSKRVLESADLSGIFGIEIEGGEEPDAKASPTPRSHAKKSKPRSTPRLRISKGRKKARVSRAGR